VSQKEENDDSDEAEFKDGDDEDDQLGNELYENSNECSVRRYLHFQTNEGLSLHQDNSFELGILS